MQTWLLAVSETEDHLWTGPDQFRRGTFSLHNYKRDTRGVHGFFVKLLFRPHSAFMSFLTDSALISIQ